MRFSMHSARFRFLAHPSAGKSSGGRLGARVPREAHCPPHPLRRTRNKTRAADVSRAVHQNGKFYHAILKADQTLLSNGTQSRDICHFSRAGFAGSTRCLWPFPSISRDQRLSDPADRIPDSVGRNAVTRGLNQRRSRSGRTFSSTRSALFKFLLHPAAGKAAMQTARSAAR
jgi:hypothetical protein